MGRSASQPECGSAAKGSSSSTTSLASEPISYGNSNRKSRKKGSKTQPKSSKDAEEIGHRSRGSIPSETWNSSPPSGIRDDFSTAERPKNAEQEKVSEASAEERLMASEAHASPILDTVLAYASRNLDVFHAYASHTLHNFSTWCRVSSARLYVEQKPLMDAFASRMMEWRSRAQSVIRQAWPPVRHALTIMGGITVALGLLWLNCTMQGFKSLARMGSAAFFMVACCSALNLGMLGGFFKLFLCLVFSAAVAFFAGYLYALVIFGIYSGVILWLYGSFWLTGGLLLAGGILFHADQPRPALLVGLLYSMYSAKVVGGWLSLFLCLNLSFLFSSLMISLLHSNDTDSSAQDFTATHEDHSNKSTNYRTRRGKRSEASDDNPSVSSYQTDSGTVRGVNATDGESSAVDKEVERLLNCKDHYAVLELSRFAEVDLVMLKKEYKKKAMLVHPDKNRGNSVAEEAFKRLQNAYEVLLDPSKKQGYDDELKKEEVLLALKRFQQEVLRNGRAGTSDNWFPHSDDEHDEDIATRRIVCKKCNNTHRWICTDRNKLQARWCQECQDHHQAKDGDGWIEQKGHALFFGMFQKVDMPKAYACADSKIFEVTEWVQCQGMKCVPNTHKPSFHVSTAGIFKSPTRGPRSNKAFSGAGNSADSFPFAHMNENMTEEEFIKWLENAMASGMFSEMNEAPSDQSDAKAGTRGKPSKKKRKGKGKW
ncbi:hypothetical protein GOP47_0015455 [Adiantum capillus-veneris]|uniref:J domain-containing protein n=1 Tax=Adiantum capillus-veneris TaxID=13818 RepID=A0A9D4UJQ1_ADICA|nr:hypothetical protein GOP47_0015455 [Adiantum capillus-veneris]